MKTRLIFITILFFALYSNEAYSQYGNNQYGSNRNGIDRSIGNDSGGQSKKKEKTDYAESVVGYLTKELKLDGLQQAAIKGIVNDNKNNIEEISKMDLSNEEKRDKMQAVNDKISNEIVKLLSKEQAEKYNKMKEEREKKALTR